MVATQDAGIVHGTGMLRIAKTLGVGTGTVQLMLRGATTGAL
jgi:hypothetical protein